MKNPERASRRPRVLAIFGCEALLAGLLLVLVSSCAPASDGPQEIRARMQRAIDSGELPGAVVLFMHRGEIVFEEAYGYADIEAERKQKVDDIFNMASTSKPEAMAVIMTLVDRGTISLDEPASKWFPVLGEQKLVDGTPVKRSPTVREMMSHTSGMFANNCAQSREQFRLLYMFDATLAASAKALSEEPFAYQPGEDFCYCGPSMQVMARAVELVTGSDFDVVADERVFEPLGMKDSFWRTGREVSDRLGYIYTKTDQGLSRAPFNRRPQPGGFILAPGGLYSTARDLARFLRMHLEGGELDGRRILSEELVLEMRTNQIGDFKPTFGDPSSGRRDSATIGDADGYGLGWILGELGPDGVARVFSHGGAWGTYIWGDADAQLGAVLLTQIPLPNASPVWNDVVPIARATWGAGE
jgi:CubicO group peptidase (beta-lactamase class C family)